MKFGGSSADSDPLPDWLSFMPTSELTEGGRVRRLANRDGETLVERLVAFDDAARSYSFLEAPFPVTDHLATLRVHQTDGGKGLRVEWFARFKPNGVSAQEESQLIQVIQASLTTASRRWPPSWRPSNCE